MKKVVSIVLCLVMALGLLAGCGSEEKYSVGVQGGSTSNFYMAGDEGWGFEGFQNIDVKKFNNAGLAVKDMLNGNTDAVVVDMGPAQQLVKANAGTKLINIPLTEEEYAFGVNKNDPELLEKVNAFITQAMSDGTIEAIMNKYFNGEGDIVGIEAGELDLEKADEQLVVATNSGFNPFEYKQGDKFVGIDMEIAAALAEYLGMELVILDMDFDAVVTSVGKNGVDIAMAGLTVNPTRAESVNFSQSYYEASQVLIVMEDDTTFDDCATAADVEEILNGK